jgi:hypothetical protein
MTDRWLDDCTDRYITDITILLSMDAQIQIVGHVDRRIDKKINQEIQRERQTRNRQGQDNQTLIDA